MFTKKFQRLKNPSSWRRIAIATWKPPNDPTVYGTLQFDATPLLKLLDQLNQQSTIRVTLTSLITKAVALILKKFPDMNGTIRFGRIYLRQSVDIFVQVAVQEEGPHEKPDLSGAKIDRCEDKTISEIAQEITAASQKIRKRQDPHFQSTLNLLRWVPSFILSGFLRFLGFLIHDLGLNFSKFGIPEDPFGSAMITNVGTLGLPAAYGPLVPISRVPLIVCVGSVTEKPWVIDGEIKVKPILELGVTFDHRFIDGLTGSRMFQLLQEIMKNPESYL